jgi:hypothetical protein
MVFSWFLICLRCIFLDNRSNNACWSIFIVINPWFLRELIPFCFLSSIAFNPIIRCFLNSQLILLLLQVLESIWVQCMFNQLLIVLLLFLYFLYLLFLCIALSLLWCFMSYLCLSSLVLNALPSHYLPFLPFTLLNLFRLLTFNLYWILFLLLSSLILLLLAWI